MRRNRSEWRPDTKTVHPPGERSKDRSMVPPIYQTATFQLSSAQQGANYALENHPSKFYTRWGNPTTRILELSVAELEGGEDALATSSGMGAISTAILAEVTKGARIVSQKTLYSGTEELFSNVLPNYGVKCDLVEARDLNEVSRSLSKGASLLYLETPANPTMDVVDIESCAKIASKLGIPVFVDNTFASPYNQTPLRLGASVVLHSATKYLGGHFNVTGGVIVGKKHFIKKAWKILKIFGPCMSPFESWLTILGLRTFSLRLNRHNHNAQEIADFLIEHPSVKAVYYPGLSTHNDHELASKQMSGFGGMLSFEMNGGFKDAKKFVEGVRLSRLAVSLGGVQTLVEHAASMTHGMLSESERRKAGISEGLIRISTGIENSADLIDDFKAAIPR